MLSFALWPYGGYNAFWDYGPAFVTDSIFWPGPYGGYGYGRRTGPRRGGAAPSSAANEQQMPDQEASCSGLAPGITDLPLDRIERAVHPTGDQVAKLEALKDASAKAKTTLAGACPNEVPLTPVGRLDALASRVKSMQQAVETVRDPLQAFYDSLNDEQKRAFDAIGENPRRGRGEAKLGGLCSDQSASFTDFPSDEIKQTLGLNADQQSGLDKLSAAAAQASSDLQKSCPAETPQNPAARLDAVGKRLDAMLGAINTVRPPLSDFYASLTDEQKAKFNVMQQPDTQPESRGASRAG